MITLEPIGHVRDARADAVDDYWGDATSRVVLNDSVGLDALDGIEQFSHVEILYLFDRVPEEKIWRGARHPRNNLAWPKVGILAQRAKNRPNRIGSTIVRVLERRGRELWVAELDAIEGTPVLDIKPVMQEFLPRDQVRQPNWSRELMAQYWVREPETTEPRVRQASDRALKRR
jgi:tRNA-Thr(GGU) m(6)t(6)A37 methyltransferase TsaA